MRIFRKAATAVLCICLVFATLSACGDDGKISEDAEYFFLLVELIESDGISLNSLLDLEDAQDYYDRLNDSDRINTEVTKAKSKLDSFYAQYDVLQDSKNFLDKANLLPAASAVKLADLNNITAAETDYNSLNAAAKDTNAVKDAYAKVTAARAAYDALTTAEQKITTFVSAVNAITTVTLDSKSAIDAAYALYNSLSASEKEKSAVITAKTSLDGKNNQYNEIKNKVDEFISEANALDGVTDYTTAALNTVAAKYNAVPESARTNAEVIAAKEHLDNEIQRLDSVNSVIDANAFIALITDLPAAFSAVQLSDLAAITMAKASYAELSISAKAVTGVDAAYVKVTDAQGFYDDLKAATDFIALADLFPAVITSEDDGKITAAEGAYNSLNERAKTVSGVSAANDKVVAARAAYNELPPVPTEKLPFFFGLELHPESIADGGFVWGDPNGQLAAYKTLYGNSSMTNAELLTKVDFAVYFYTSTATQTSTPVYRYVLQNQDPELWILQRARMHEILSQAGVESGSYKMALIGEDKTGQFLNSDFSGFSSPNYTFTK